MSKMDKEFERKAQIQKTKKNFKMYYERYAQQEEELIVLAAQCKKENRMLDYKQTIETLKYISNGKRKMSKYIYQIELVEILKDEGQIGKEFVRLMGEVDQETADIYKSININEAKKIAENNRKIAVQQQTFNEYLQSIADTENGATESDIDLDKELMDKINALVDGENTKTNKTVDANSDLDELQKTFNLK